MFLTSYPHLVKVASAQIVDKQESLQRVKCTQTLASKPLLRYQYWVLDIQVYLMRE